MTEYQLPEPSVDDEQASVDEMAEKTRAIVESIASRTGGSISAAATIWNNLAMFGSADKYLYALDSRTGKIVWKCMMGGAVTSSPFIYNELAYVSSYDHNVYALRVVDGSIVWKFRTGDINFAPPIVYKGIAYVGSLDGYLYALNADTGELVWKFKTGNMLVVGTYIVNGIVFTASDDFNIYALDSKTGALKWKFRGTGPPTALVLTTSSGKMLLDARHAEPAETSEPVVVCFGTWGSDHIFILDAKTGRLISHNRMMSGKLFFPSVHDGIFYCGSEDQNMYAFDLKTGSVLWKFYTGGIVSAYPYVNDGVIYFGSYDHYLYAIDLKTGRPLWKFKTDGVITASATIVGNVLYFGSWDTYFYALDIEKRELLWKFKVAAPPSELTFVEHVTGLKRLRRSIIRWWKPEQRITVYETKTTMQQAGGPAAYKTEIGYKSEVGYKSNTPVGYEMQRKDKKKDWRRDPWAK